MKNYLVKYLQKDILLTAFLAGMIYLLVSALHDVFAYNPRREIDVVRIIISLVGLAFWSFIIVLEYRRRRKGRGHDF